MVVPDKYIALIEVSPHNSAHFYWTEMRIIDRTTVSAIGRSVRDARMSEANNAQSVGRLHMRPTRRALHHSHDHLLVCSHRSLIRYASHCSLRFRAALCSFARSLARSRALFHIISLQPAVQRLSNWRQEDLSKGWQRHAKSLERFSR